VHCINRIRKRAMGFSFFSESCTVPALKFCRNLDTLGGLDGFAVVWREPHYHNGS